MTLPKFQATVTTDMPAASITLCSHDSTTFWESLRLIVSNLKTLHDFLSLYVVTSTGYPPFTDLQSYKGEQGWLISTNYIRSLSEYHSLLLLRRSVTEIWDEEPPI
jgi:hypothetical protein